MEGQRAGDMEGAVHVAKRNSLARFASSSSLLLLTTTPQQQTLPSRRPQPPMFAPALFCSLLAFIIAVLALHATLTNADHFTCTWKPHDGSPEKFNYTQFCRAQLLRDNSDNNLGDWVCAAGNVAPVGTKVADYSRLRKSILELGEWTREGLALRWPHWVRRADTALLFTASPCAHRGYAIDEGTCISNTFAMCWGPSSQGACLYQNAKDDCAYEARCHGCGTSDR